MAISNSAQTGGPMGGPPSTIRLVHEKIKEELVMKNLGKVLVAVGVFSGLVALLEAWLGGMFGTYDRSAVVVGLVLAAVMMCGGGCAYHFGGHGGAARRRMYKGGQLVLLAALVGVSASGCATARFQRVEVKIPDKIVEFVSAGNKAVFNRNMPTEARYIVNNWVRGAGGQIVDDPRAPLRFEWNATESSVATGYGARINGYTAVGCVRFGCNPGQIVMDSLGGAVGAVLGAITVNSIPLGGYGYQRGYYYGYANRVTVWFFLTGMNASGQRQLAFNGKGQFDYFPGDPRCDRLCAYEQATLQALLDMH